MKGFHTQSLECMEKFCVPERYHDLKFVGRGSFGSVCRACDAQRKGMVAIKKMYEPLKESRIQYVYREISLLKAIDHPNVISLIDAFTPDGQLETFSSVYLVMPFIKQTLKQCLGKEWRIDNVKSCTYQLLKGLRYLHSANVVHRDLKPGNIGITSHQKVVILDLGLARFKERTFNMTQQVCTLWYRAPEIICQWSSYSEKVDIWSVGCIMAELLKGSVLFQGDNNFHQIELILRNMGMPKDLLDTLSSNMLMYVEDLKLGAPKDLREIIPNASAEGIGLLKRLLSVDHNQRCSAHEAIESSFFYDASERGSDSESKTLQYIEKAWKNPNLDDAKKLVWEAIHDQSMRQKKCDTEPCLEELNLNQS